MPPSSPLPLPPPPPYASGPPAALCLDHSQILPPFPSGIAQQICNRILTAIDSGVERCAAARLYVHLCPVAEQQLHHLRLAPAAGDMKRRLAGVICTVDINDGAAADDAAAARQQPGRRCGGERATQGKARRGEARRGLSQCVNEFVQAYVCTCVRVYVRA